MKVAVLWTHLSGYMNSCLKELAQREGVEIFVCHQASDNSAPFDEAQFAWIRDRSMWRSAPASRQLEERLRSFSPDVLIFAGWHIPAYRRIARRFSRRCLRVMTMDNCWQATLKQWIGVASAPYCIRPLADAVWLPGERQAVFARKMGFRQGSILRGLYTCDRRQMESPFLARIEAQKTVPRRFIFVGRFIPEKGIETLVKAYELYRDRQTTPWPLFCCGAGPLQSLLEGRAGISVEGFVQPSNLPDKLSGAGCLVLPSSFEPWALVIHEAASAGLLIVASENVGAAVHLVQPGYNGYICGCRRPSELAELMSRVSSMDDSQLDKMSRASHDLSQQFSPGQWADTIVGHFQVWANQHPSLN